MIDSIVPWMDAWVSVFETRTLGSAVILLTGIILYLLAPTLVRRLIRLRTYEPVERYAGAHLDVLERRVDWPFPTHALIRVVQTAVLFCAAIGLLILWGYRAEAVFVVEVLALALPWVIRLLVTFGLLAGGLLLVRVLEDWLDAYTADADQISEHQESVTFRVVQISVFGAIGIAILSLWGVDLTGLLVGAGFLGIVLGMAARQTLGSMIAGLVLMFSRPFEIGDWIKVDDQEGIVTDITIINTRLRTFNAEAVVIPNQRVSNQTVVNYSASEQLRLELDVGIDYDTDLGIAQEAAQGALEGVDTILAQPEPSVVPTTFGDSAIGLCLRFWIRYPSKPKEWAAKADVLEAVKSAFDREGISIPFPQRELSGEVRQVVDDRIAAPERYGRQEPAGR